MFIENYRQEVEKGAVFMNKAWLFVLLTSIVELIWVYGFNVANTWWHWLIIVSIILLDFMFLSKACETLPTGTVYAVFAAFGTIGTALMDVFIFDGDFSFSKGFFIAVIVSGVIALKLTDNEPDGTTETGIK